MGVYYTIVQRRVAKDNKKGLVTLSCYDSKIGTTTIQGPASEAIQDIVNKAISEVIGIWGNENNKRKH